MKKILLFFLGLVLVAASAGCAASPSTPKPAPPADTKSTPTADVAGANPLTGFVVSMYNNPPAYLFASPSNTSKVLGQLFADQNAQLLGIDPSNQWYLIKVNGTTAWVSVARVSATIAQ